MPCRAVELCCIYYFVPYIPAIIRSTTPGTGTPGVYVLNHTKKHFQLSSTQLAQQRSAAPCGAVPCGVALCRNALCSLSYIQQHQVSCEVPGTKYRYVRVCQRPTIQIVVFAFFFIEISLRVFCSSFLFRKIHPYWRSERGVASKHTAQHRAVSSAVSLAIIKSLVVPKHGPLLFAPFTFCCILPRASIAGGVSRPRSGALAQNTNYNTEDLGTPGSTHDSNNFSSCHS